MTRPRPVDLAFTLLLALCVFLFGFLVLVWHGTFVTGEPEGQQSHPRPTQASASAPILPAVQAPATPVNATAPSAPKLELARVSIVASRGSCWVSAHRGSASGPVLVERVVEQGETLDLAAPRIWVELGAAGNVDVTVNGKARAVTPGTIDLLLS
jgi:hypothetical protein